MEIMLSKLRPIKPLVVFLSSLVLIYFIDVRQMFFSSVGYLYKFNMK